MEKWGVSSLWNFWAIMISFSLAGSSILFVKKLFFPLFHITESTPLWIKIPAYILIMIPSYQVLLLFFGTLLGQFRFFWEKEKKFARLLARPFVRKSA